MPAPGAIGPTAERLDLAARVAELRSEGLMQREVATRLGISCSYVAELDRDPEGAKARTRKESYSLPCPQCGRPMSGGDGPSHPPDRCAACAASDPPRIWTKETVIVALQNFATVIGRAPSVTDVVGSSPSIAVKLGPERRAEIDRGKALAPLPASATVIGLFGSWPAAVGEAGLATNLTGGAGHRVRAPGYARLLKLLEERGEMSSHELREAFGYNRNWANLLRRHDLNGAVLRERRGNAYVYRLAERPPQEGAKPMAREFMVLSRNGKGWEETGTVSAADAERAIEQVATAEGEYVAIPVPFWQSRKVGTVTRLGVLSPDE